MAVFHNGVPVITLDSPFDARLIKEFTPLTIESNETRLLIDIHVVDFDSKIVTGLRSITMPACMTREFLAAAESQRSQPEQQAQASAQIDKWYETSPVHLSTLTEMKMFGG
jgi:hypothetical protein